MDGFNWSTADFVAGLRFKTSDGAEIKGGMPRVDDSRAEILTVRWPTDSPKGEIVITFTEAAVTISAEGGMKDAWYLEWSSAPKAELPFRNVEPKKLSCVFRKAPYVLIAKHGVFTKAADSSLRITSEEQRITLDFSVR